MKKSKLKYVDTSGHNSSTIQIDASVSTSTYEDPTETRVIEVDLKTR